MAMRPNSLLVFMISLLLITCSASAMYLVVEGPVSELIYNNGSINLGKVGPGESFYILASATTSNQSGTIVNIGWDTLKEIDLPNGWAAQASPLYENPMKMKVTVAPFAAEGNYKMTIRAVNIGNYSKLGNLTFSAYITVSTDVFNSSVTPHVVDAGIGEPINLKIVINNTGASDDPFMINAYGLPAWNSPVEVIASHSTNNTYAYPVFVNEPGVYNFNVTINSTTSPLIHHTYPITLVARASILNDYMATGQGVVLSPIIYEPSYAFMLLLSDIYHLIFK